MPLQPPPHGPKTPQTLQTPIPLTPTPPPPQYYRRCSRCLVRRSGRRSRRAARRPGRVKAGSLPRRNAASLPCPGNSPARRRSRCRGRSSYLCSRGRRACTGGRSHLNPLYPPPKKRWGTPCLPSLVFESSPFPDLPALGVSRRHGVTCLIPISGSVAPFWGFPAAPPPMSSISLLHGAEPCLPRDGRALSPP